MPATDLQIYDQFTNNQALYKKVLVENLKLAAYIVDESAEAEFHTERLEWAKYVIQNPWEAASRMLVLVMSNGDVQEQEDPDDATILFIVGLYTTKLALLGLVVPEASQ